MSKFAVLAVLDRWGHRLLDPYCRAKPLGHHLPGWGLVQLGQWYVCNAYEREVQRATGPTEAPASATETGPGREQAPDRGPNAAGVIRGRENAKTEGER